MADDQNLARELTDLLEGLPRTHLVEVARQAGLGGFQVACRRLLEGQSLKDVLASLFPDFSEAQILDAEEEMGLCAVRNTCWSQLLSPPEEGKVQIRCSNPEAAQALRERTGPAIVASWHLGASHMISLGLQSIRVPALAVARKAPPAWFGGAVSAEMKMEVTQDDPAKSILVLKAALDHLRHGGVVAMAVDGGHGQKEHTFPFLGRRIPLSLGTAVLSRLTGAPIIPAIVTWGQKDWSLDFRLFDPLRRPAAESMQPDAWDEQVIAVAAERFEGIVRAFPGQSRLERLCELAKAPRI